MRRLAPAVGGDSLRNRPPVSVRLLLKSVGDLPLAADAPTQVRKELEDVIARAGRPSGSVECMSRSLGAVIFLLPRCVDGDQTASTKTRALTPAL